MNIKDLIKQTVVNKMKGLSVYETHESYVKEYFDFLYLKDTAYTQEEVSVLSDIQPEDPTKPLVYDKLNVDRKLLKVQKYVCKMLAKTMFSENTELQIDNDKDIINLEALQQFYTENGIFNKLENIMFDVFGVGTVGVCTYYDKLEGIRTQTYQAFNIYPLKIIDDKITDVCFRSVKDNENIVLNIFLRKEIYNETIGEYGTSNKKTKAYKGYDNYIYEFNKDGTLISEANITPTYSEVRPFIILKPYNINSVDYTSAIGYPIYWDSLDIIKTIDKFYNLADKDADASMKQTFVDSNMIKEHQTGKVIIPRELKTAHIVALSPSETNTSNTKSFIHTHAPDMIVRSLYEEVEFNLQLLGQNIGVGSNELTIEKILAPTATEVISNNSDKYVTVKKHMNSMYTELLTLNSAYLFLLNQYNSEYKGKLDHEAKIGFMLDDGVITDSESYIKLGGYLLSIQAISQKYFLERYLKLGEKEVNEILEATESKLPIQPEDI